MPTPLLREYPTRYIVTSIYGRALEQCALESVLKVPTCMYRTTRKGLYTVAIDHVLDMTTLVLFCYVCKKQWRTLYTLDCKSEMHIYVYSNTYESKLFYKMYEVQPDKVKLNFGLKHAHFR